MSIKNGENGDLNDSLCMPCMLMHSCALHEHSPSKWQRCLSTMSFLSLAHGFFHIAIDFHSSMRCYALATQISGLMMKLQSNLHDSWQHDDEQSKDRPFLCFALTARFIPSISNAR